jgi:hypothetical protein
MIARYFSVLSIQLKYVRHENCKSRNSSVSQCSALYYYRIEFLRLMTIPVIFTEIFAVRQSHSYVLIKSHPLCIVTDVSHVILRALL